MNKYIPERIKVFEEYIPNGADFKVRIDANENPYPVPELLRREMLDIVQKVETNRYPDPSARELISAFSTVYGRNPQNVIAGNGSDELITIIFTAFTEMDDNVTVTSPDFSMYGIYASIAGCRVNEYRKNDANEIDFDDLTKQVRETCSKVVIISNPCNPTGKSYPKEEILRFAGNCDCIVVIDEAYAEFCGEKISVMDEAEKRDNLIVLKTLSKAFGMAALRVGFAISNIDMITALRKIKSPYNVSTISQKIGTAALKYSDIFFDTAKKLGKSAKQMAERISELKSDITVFDTSTNFVFIRFNEPGKAEYIFSGLMKKGISVRLMRKRFLRVTAGTDEENEMFIVELEKLIKQ